MIPASTTNYPFRPSPISRPATIRHSGSAIYLRNFPNGSPRRSRCRLGRPIAVSARPADRMRWEQPDSRTWRRHSNIGSSRTPGRNSTTTFGIDPDSGDLTADTEFHPRVLNWGGTIQYSMPYLKSAVIDLGLPDFINRFIPLVEATLQTPVSNTFTSGTMTTGTINPGFLWVGNTFQIGIEALIPINRQSGTNVGVIAQLHFYLDDIDPRGIGKPIFGGAVQPASPFPRN